MPDIEIATDGMTGSVIAGRYRVTGLLGRGGMAAVYRAEDESLGRTVAVKVFAAGGAEAESLKREASEIRLLATMNHHALVTLFDASVDSVDGAERAFLVMELVDGPTLQQRLGDGPLASREVAITAVDLAEALHVVHDRGVVHRDIKPGNILLSPALSADREYRAKLADFGIAYLIDSTRLTTPGTLVGTAAYLSPEQANGSAPGPACDVYSLGLVLLEALTGERAFPGSLIESLTARLMRSPEIPGSLGYEWKSLLSRMTARNPEERPTPIEVADAARAIYAATFSTDAPPSAATRAIVVADLDSTVAMPALSGADSTSAMDATVAMDAPAAMDATAAMDSTAAMLAARSVAPTATAAAARFDDASATAVLSTVGGAPGAAAAAAASSVDPGQAARARRRRMIILAAVLLLAVAAALVVWSLLSGSPPPAAPDMPELGDPLGGHLDDLMESVTP
jgi:predicted Ser/Thr protein kinase